MSENIKVIKYPKILKDALAIWLHIDSMVVFHEHNISHSRIKVVEKACEKLLGKITNSKDDFEWEGSNMKMSEHLRDLLDKPDKYPSVYMTRLQQYIHEMIRHIGKTTGDKSLDDRNPSYYKRVLGKMK